MVAALAAPTEPLLTPLAGLPARVLAADRSEGDSAAVPPSGLIEARAALVLQSAYRLRPVETEGRRRRRRRSTETMLGWLVGFPGQTWAARWLASEAEGRGRDWYPRSGPARAEMTEGLATLLCLRVLRPGYRWLLGERLLGLWSWFPESNDPRDFALLAELASGHHPAQRDAAVHALIRVMLHTGKTIRQLRADDLMAYVEVVTATGRPNGMHLGWLLLRRLGVLDGDAPATLHAARTRGQLSVTELVDRYQLSCQPVRGVLIRYLTDRSATLDHASLRVLTSRLVGLFWRAIERLAPGIDTLRLEPELAARWKDSLATVGGTSQRRLERDAVLMSVRAFYQDLAQWAQTEPATWASWAAPNPIRDADLAAYSKNTRRRAARMQQRTRTLAPLLPTLTASTEQHLRASQLLLTAALRTEEGADFTVADRRYQRIRRSHTGPGGRPLPGGRVRVRDGDETGRILDVGFEETDAFWSWAIVAVLRQTGVRIEEMLEITHLSLRRYVRENTEVVPLLQIAPSKTDIERVVPISPELLHVLAQIVARVMADQPQVPLVARYDEHEKTWGPALPHLFQRPQRGHHGVLSARSVQTILDRATRRAGLADVDGSPLRFTPHDFRRIFATDLVNSGLPIHIGAALLGHLSLQTTRGYVAIYPERVIEHFQAFIDRRRAERPGEEYREPTDTEWAEFREHFGLRQVELGECGRPYGTPCIHEHACLRCPMLRVNPDQLPRLLELEGDIQRRVELARARGWLGEVAGLQATLTHLWHKKEQAARLTQPTPTAVALGMPGRRHDAVASPSSAHLG